MIVVRLELWPHGDEEERKELGLCFIFNEKGIGDKDLGNYAVRISRWDDPLKIWKEGWVHRFRRKRLGAWDLLYQALRSMIGYRNPESPELPIRKDESRRKVRRRRRRHRSPRPFGPGDLAARAR